MKNKNNLVILIIIVLILLILGFFLIFNKTRKNLEQLDLTKTSSNYQVDDELLMFLYERYQTEDGLLFSLVGSDSTSQDYYAYYYKQDKISFQNFSDIVRNFILLDTINYKDQGYDEGRYCYLYSLDEFKDLYRKNFGNLDSFEIKEHNDVTPIIYQDDDTICITEESSNKYQYTIDTYMVNAFYQNDYAIIYERVAFVKVTDVKLEFYKDYQMKDEVYTLDRSNIDMSFINNSKIVSNVLLEYQNQFDLYQYTYVKGEGTYYLESIEK